MTKVSSPLLSKKLGNTKLISFALPIFLFLLFAGWAVSSPPGSSPDDDYHLSSIWCAWGEQNNTCIRVGTSQVAVPKAVGDPHTCFAFKTQTSAECTRDIPMDTLTVTERENNIMKLYPTLYYKTFHIFSHSSVVDAVVAIRLFNAALASLLLLAILRLTPMGVKIPYLVAYTLGIVPLGLFIIPSTNPSSWAIMGITSFWAFATTLLWRTNTWRDPRTIGLVLLVSVSAVLSIGSRPDSMIYVGVATITAALFVGWRKVRSNLAPFLFLVFLSIMGVYFFLNTRTPGGGEVMGRHEQNIELLFSNLLQVPYLYQGILGGGALGWNDAPMYSIVPFIGVLLLGGIVYASFSTLSWGKIRAGLFAFLTCVAVPLFFLQIEGLQVGEVVQPRYLVPLFFLFVMMLATGPDPRTSISLKKNYLFVYSLALAFTAMISFASHLHRYAEGGAPQFGFGGWSSEWTPLFLNVPILLTYVALCTILFFSLAGFFIYKETRKSVSLVKS